jgi:hypothetical protein
MSFHVIGELLADFIVPMSKAYISPWERASGTISDEIGPCAIEREGV